MSPLLQAQGLGWHCRRRRLVRDVSLALHPGELVGLIGPNGAGKSSLVRLLAGLQAPSEGRVMLQGRPLAAWPAAARAQRIGYLPQSFAPHWDVTLAELLRLGAGRGDATPPADLEALAAAFGLAGRLAQRWSSLSGGERGRALLAGVLAAEPPVLLADEPGAALDVAQQWRMMARLRARPPGCAALVVLHDLNLAARWCDRLLVMQEGRLALQGQALAVLADPALDALYGMAFERQAVPGGLRLWPSGASGA
ncbi:ABC transporter ATP-binding protein [Pseudoroseomonas cervicalis]|uniref:ABC transporter ATP-binding protein n=1 Tax=Teichococcus cervicalis TaxID=204525 RepID=UPI002788F2DB|nr:ABC transporter ATP-binding protein [Pseudoroseomonas cervicalis]MDQ1080083.1 iron complex transport system ATP-binding protein [Pseudoroseomonas cervicalis]